MSHPISEAKLRSWMQRLGPRLIVLSTGICRDRHQAEEIVQEAFVKLWKAPPDAGEIAYTSWLRRVVTNLSINALAAHETPRCAPRVLERSRALQARRETDHSDRVNAKASTASMMRWRDSIRRSARS